MAFELMTQRTWREIRLTAMAHGLHFDTNQTRQEGFLSVRHQLIEEGQLERAYRRLADGEREPLLALQLASGSMPLHQFTAQFGDIRPYRPWRENDDEANRFAWKRPISAAERLWHLGMVEIQRGKNGQPDQVTLPDEVATLLPPVPRPRTARSQPRPVVMRDSRAILRRDLGALLAGLLAGEGRWMRGRWLTPRSLRRLNRRLIRSDHLAGVRSERQAGRIRFYHYLLHAAGLLDGGLVTAAAWSWLEDDAAWTRLWTAVQHDLSARDSLWNRYGLPAINPVAWGRLVSLLNDLQPEHDKAVRRFSNAAMAD